ncbi:GGDEF domain-containing protein [Noviherbaspirillum sedimenti]|uniref:Diguanylate cyclase n=1 Tax=Noviherbaspirillum sedimenti TaxID=2320865 RepID=A0A3A3GJI5_9BURK|nr:GGDEF domain-containing protein [Noviherbaspirillum sedimenti]RJG02466.1 diguanylate cyclase [Noviherbaspirillum sedimenti]
MKKFPVYAYQILGLAIALFGATIALRWIFQIEAIAHLIPGSEQMGLNTPLMFLASGLACVCLPQRQPPLQVLLRLCILLLMVLPGLTMVQHLFGVNLGIDFVRVPSMPSASIPYPGRMAPNTTLGFLCAGMALLLLSRPGRERRRDRLGMVAIAATMLIGLAALAGYFMRLDALYHLASFNQMLVPTAAVMSMLGCCLWLLRQHRYNPRQGGTSAYQRRITWRAGVVLTLVALAAGVAGFAVVRNVLEKALTDNMLFATTTNATSMANILDDRLAFHRTIVTRPIVQRQFVRLAANPQDREARDFLQTAASNLLTAGPSGVRMLDADGRLIAASGQVLRERAPLAQHLQRAGQNAYLVWQDDYLLYAETPVLANGHRVGTVVVEQPLPAFDKLLHVIQTSGDSTDALLCSRRQDAALCAPSRFNSGVTSIPAHLEGKAHDQPIHRALAGQRGVISILDLRKVPVFSAYTPLQDFGLGLVIQSDSDSLYAPLKAQTQLLTALLVALVALGTTTMGLAVRPLLERIERDITDLRLAEEKLAGSEKRLRSITDNLPVLISYIDREQKYGFCNRTFETWTGVPPQQVLQHHVAEVLGQERYVERQANIALALSGQRVEFDIATLGGDGTLRQLHTTFVPDIAADGTVLGIYTLSTDVSALHAVQRQLQQMARFDALTGLPNRYQMNEKLVEAIARCRRAGTPMALMFLDIDHFKAINDSLGHAAGDEMLKEFGRRLKASVRETDAVCRLAGDEFLIILEQLGSTAETEGIARKILANAGAPCKIQGQPLRIGTSIGIAYCQEQPLLPDALIDHADQALYQAKQAGRGTFRLILC